MVYGWKRGYFTADPQKVGEELEALELRDAESVVKAARKKKSALHGCFEWDDSIAGEAYRKDQARLVLRMLVTEIEKPGDTEGETITIRAFESVRFPAPSGELSDKAMVYIPTREALADPQLRQQVIGRLMSTIADAETTAEHYEYLVPSFRIAKQKLTEARIAITN